MGIHLGVESLGCMITCVQPFEELSDCFSKQLYHFTSLPAMYEGSSCSTSLSTVIICLFAYSPPVGWGAVSSVVLIYIFHMANDIEHLFLGLLAIYIYSFETFTNVDSDFQRECKQAKTRVVEVVDSSFS